VNKAIDEARGFLFVTANFLWVSVLVSRGETRNLWTSALSDKNRFIIRAESS